MLKFCINSQTPPVRFSIDYSRMNYANINNFIEGKDYIFSPGGVTRMVYPFILKCLKNKLIDNPHWISLNPFAPSTVDFNGIILHGIKMEQSSLKGYGYTKEMIWKILHGMEDPKTIFWEDEFADYIYYNRKSSLLMQKLDKEIDFDIFYIHDFQQLPIGSMIKTLKPKIFRWHIPFNENFIPQSWKDLLLVYFNSYDAIIVSSDKFKENLIKIGYKGKVFKIYPYIDLSSYKVPNKSIINDFYNKFNISKDDKIILNVARMDPIKRQDIIIKAVAKLIKKFKNLKLILVGNGSFSSSKQGIGLNKAEAWTNYLRSLIKEYDLERNVVLTGHLSEEYLHAAYYISDLMVLSSFTEGFGLVVIESWIYKKPVVVSSEVGVAELVDGQNGFLFDPLNIEDLSSKIEMILTNEKLALEMGLNGYETAKKCSLEEGYKKELEVLKSVLGEII
jgi:glycosyltransferase involved in cell wall biosynthesis